MESQQRNKQFSLRIGTVMLVDESVCTILQPDSLDYAAALALKSNLNLSFYGFAQKRPKTPKTPPSGDDEIEDYHVECERTASRIKERVRDLPE